MFDHCSTTTGPSGITSRGNEASKSNTFLVFFFPSLLLSFFILCLFFHLHIVILSLSPLTHPTVLPLPFYIHPRPPHTCTTPLWVHAFVSAVGIFCLYLCVWCGCSWSPAAVCAPDSAQLLLHSGGGLEVSDHTSLSASHHRLLPWSSDPAERLHWRLLWPAAPQWLGEVERCLSLE